MSQKFTCIFNFGWPMSERALMNIHDAIVARKGRHLEEKCCWFHRVAKNKKKYIARARHPTMCNCKFGSSAFWSSQFSMLHNFKFWAARKLTILFSLWIKCTAFGVFLAFENEATQSGWLLQSKIAVYWKRPPRVFCAWRWLFAWWWLRRWQSTAQEAFH